MCKYCRVIEYGNFDTAYLACAEKSLKKHRMVENEKVKVTIKDNMTLESFAQIFFISPDEIYLGVSAYLADDDGEELASTYKRVKIKYCPICGRKLDEK